MGGGLWTTCVVIVLLLSFLSHITAQVVTATSARGKSKAKCDICMGISVKFYEGLNKTKKANFGGGNTKWEEKSLGKFYYSETRLLEIMEQLCERTNSECHHMVEEGEELIEEYWRTVFTLPKPTFFHEWFCINNVQVCCKNGTYGKECTPCPGGAELPCSGNGDCKGSGTREGDGKCSCHTGYTGAICKSCETNYFAAFENTTHITCEACDQSCKDTCHKAGPTGCDECKDGYRPQDDLGCVDVDECEENKQHCDGKTFCFNKPGSYICKACNEACELCTGEGADNCLGCALGFLLNDTTCDDVNECDDLLLCRGDNEKCENTPGSYFCGCVTGFIRSNDACIPEPKDENQTENGVVGETDEGDEESWTRKTETRDETKTETDDNTEDNDDREEL